MPFLNQATTVQIMQELSMDRSCRATLSLSLELLQKKLLALERKYMPVISAIRCHIILIHFSSHIVSIGVTMSNAGVAPFYYPLTLNAKAVDTKTGAVVSSKSTVVPILNQLDQHSFVYDFNITVKTDTNVQFSIWLNSTHLVGNQTIVFAISNASASGVIQLPTFPIAPCTSSIAFSKVNAIPFTTGTDTNV